VLGELLHLENKKTFLIMLAVTTISLCNAAYAQVSKPVGFDSAMESSMSGLIAHRIRLGLIAENIANVSTLKVEETGLPYAKQYAVLEPYKNGVRVKSIEKNKEPFHRYSDGAVTQADEEGMMSFPNVSLPEEMMNMSYTEVMYEANSTCFKTTKALYQSTIDILK
jgi:flagellar basal-body rod protein FlgC